MPDLWNLTLFGARPGQRQREEVGNFQMSLLGHFTSPSTGGDNWAVSATLIENCKISGINPHAWLAETLSKIAAGHPANAVGELMPWTTVV